MQTERSNAVSRAAAAVLLVSCLVVGIVIGARGSSSSGNNLRAHQYSAASVGSTPSQDKAGSLVPLKPLKHSGDEHLAGDIDVGSPAGAWGPDDEEKDDWVNLFGMDGARIRKGSPVANLPSFNDLMVEDTGSMSFSFSYDYSDEDAWFH
ncbi:unnamed protein product [Ectocarpus fasciculatus]